MAGKSKYNEGRVGPDGLTTRERAFVHAFRQTLVETKGKGNATKAAIMIGVPEGSASVLGSGLMKRDRVKSAIAVLIDETCKKFDITSERILQELSTMAFSNMADYLVFGEDGSARVDWSKLSREQSAAISEVTIDEYEDRTGTDEEGKPTYETVKRIRFKLHDKKGSLELLGRHHKLFTDNVAVSNPDGSPLAAPNFVVQFVKVKVGDGQQRALTNSVPG